MPDPVDGTEPGVPWFPPQGGDIALIERCVPGGDPYSIAVCWHHDDQAWWNATGVPGPMKAQPQLDEFRELVIRKNRLVSKTFTPDEQAMRRMVLSANGRAKRLAARIVAAEHAVKRGQSSTVVLALLGGAEDGPVVLPDGCVDGHSPDLVSCELGVDWP